MWPVADGDPAWAVFVATSTGDPIVRLGNARDAFEWVALDEARDRCTALVSATLDLVA
jgi:hypothetical protein